MGRSAIDLTGQKFGHVVVLKRSEKIDPHKRALWICQCDCGTIFETSSRTIRFNKSGENYSCGCKRTKSPNAGIKTENLTGKKFGWLTALERNYTYARENGLKEEVFWNCQCECGNLITVRGYSLRHGITKSCGCMKNCAEDLTGKIFGKLQVIGPDFDFNKKKRENDKNKALGIYWFCKCECGEKVSVSTNYLMRTKVPHCDKCKIFQGEDLTGQQFGYLTVIERDYNYNKEKNVDGTYWKCKCICGNLTSVRKSALKDGTTISCGCKRRENTKERQVIDITNQKFDHLLVLKPVYDYSKQRGIKNSGHIVYWECLCDCGNICVKPGTELRAGRVSNCGSCASSLSKGEEKIKELLDYGKISYVYNENYFKDLKNPDTDYCLRYDFVIINENNKPLYLIEYDGEQHFRPVKAWGGEERFKKQKEADKIKNDYATAHNLPLIRIPYTHYSNLSLKDLQLETTTFLIN